MRKYVIYLMTVVFVLLAVFAACKKDKEVSVTGVLLNGTAVTLAPDSTITLIATVQPDNATNKAVTWTSSNSSIAEVNEGTVTAKAEGTATITVTTQDGGKTATCIVTVNKDAILVTGVTLDKETLTLAVDSTETLIVTVLPEEATNKAVTWTSSNSTIAEVNEGTVTAKAEGTATITVTTQDGGKTATCIVTVSKDTIPVTGVTLNKETLTLAVDSTDTLIVTVLPEEATNKAVTWTSSNSTIAEVNEGTVTAKAEGTAIITVTTQDGGKTATCTLTVLSSVVINGIRWATRNVNKPGTFATKPENAGMFYQWNRKIGWSSTNPLVNSDGGTTWNSTNAQGTTWEPVNDPCPTGWRVPTHEELESLAAADNYWGKLNGVSGRFFGSDENPLFLPAAGFRFNAFGAALTNVGTNGLYWSSTPNGTTSAYYLGFKSNNEDPYFAGIRADAFCIRCVAAE